MLRVFSRESRQYWFFIKKDDINYLVDDGVRDVITSLTMGLLFQVLEWLVVVRNGWVKGCRRIDRYDLI